MDIEQINLMTSEMGKSPGYPFRKKYMPLEQQNPELNKHKDFDYYFNNYGFRSIDEEDYSLNDSNDIWCLGCSFTFGTGVSRHDTWPSLIQKHTNRKVKNLGVGGGGPITTLRVLSHWYHMSTFKPKQIFILGFFEGRDEIWDNEMGQYKLLHHIDNMKDSYDKSIKEMKSIADNVRIIDVEASLQDAKQKNLKDWGRDGCEKWADLNHKLGHPGVKYHDYIAKRFMYE